VIATNARKPIFGYRAMIMSIIAIFFDYCVGHHVFSGMNPFFQYLLTTLLMLFIPLKLLIL
jgi:cytochrome c oxidase subunit 1